MLEVIVTSDGCASQILVVDLWTAAASMKQQWRPLPNGDSSPDVLRALRSMCSSRSCSTSRFAESCEACHNQGAPGALSFPPVGKSFAGSLVK